MHAGAGHWAKGRGLCSEQLPQILVEASDCTRPLSVDGVAMTTLCGCCSAGVLTTGSSDAGATRPRGELARWQRTCSSVPELRPEPTPPLAAPAKRASLSTPPCAGGDSSAREVTPSWQHAAPACPLASHIPGDTPARQQGTPIRIPHALAPSAEANAVPALFRTHRKRGHCGRGPLDTPV